MKKIKVAACQMQAELGNIAANLARAERMIEEAFSKGTQWVILPEFFTSGMSFDPCMLNAALPLDGPATKLLVDAAHRHNGYVGGSFIAFKGEARKQRHNTFVLARPDGTYGIHNKDIPTFWENCYYLGGSDDGVIATEEYNVGVALCAELWRWRTAKRLMGRVDFVVGGSGWWNFPTNVPIFKNFLAKQREAGLNAAKECIAEFARILGVPVVIACGAGPLKCRTPMMPFFTYESYFMGETQIVDAEGRILARMTHDDGEGIITAEIEPGQYHRSIAIEDNKFWIPKATWFPKLLWTVLGAYGRRYYQKMAKKGIY